MCVVLQDIDFVKDIVMSPEKQLLAVFVKKHLRDFLSSQPPLLHLIKDAVKCWQENGRVRVEQVLCWNK